MVGTANNEAGLAASPAVPGWARAAASCAGQLAFGLRRGVQQDINMQGPRGHQQARSTEDIQWGGG